MDDLFKGLSSQAMLWILFAWIGLFMLAFLLTIGFKKNKKNFSSSEWLIIFALITCSIGGFVVIIMEIDYKNRFEEARLYEIIPFNRGSEQYLITISQSVTSGKSSTTYWLTYDILNAQTGKRIKRESINLGKQTWDFKILGNNDQFIFLNHYGVKWFDPFGQAKLLGEADIQAQMEQKLPALRGKIAKLEVKTENIGNVILLTMKTGELQCFGLFNFQKIDCQTLSYPPGKLNPFYKPSRLFFYFDYVAHQWNDSTWLTLVRSDKNNPYKTRLYQHRGMPNYDNGIQVTITEGDSTRNLLPQAPTRAKTFPERLELFSSTEFLGGSLLFCLADQAFLKTVSEIGTSGKNRLTAYNLPQKKIDWQVEIENLKLSPQASANYKVQIIQKG
jgi:hypothetical protein